MSTLSPRQYTPLLWLPFFATPFIEPNIYADGIARDLAVLATALFAAAAIGQKSFTAPRHPNYHSWIFLLLCLLPAAIVLAHQSAQAPWFVWRQSLYLTAAWLVFSMLHGHRLFTSKVWILLLAVAAHLYTIYAVIGALHLPWLSSSGAFLFWSDNSAHFAGPLRQQNQQALFLVIAITLMWRHAWPPQQRWWQEIATWLPIAGLFLTASRSGLIILLLAALLVWTFNRFRSQTTWMLIRTITVGAIVSIGILAITPTQTDSSVVAHAHAALSDTAPSIRIMVWDICLQLWWDHPWLGVGWGNLAAHFYDAAAPVMAAHPEFAPIASSFSGGVTKTHNLILQFLVEGGMVAASALLLLLVALANVARQWWHNPPPSTSGAVSGWICAVVILAHGMVSVAIMEPFFMVLLALSLAACFTNDHHAH